MTSLTGLLRASCSLNPFLSRERTVLGEIPWISAHSVRERVSPFNVILRVRDVFLFCSDWVAHRQLSAEYPRLLSIRSIDRPGGGSPMSAANLSKDADHSVHTEMPRPPYLSHFLFFGLVHRSSIPRHVRYSFVAPVLRVLWPCLVRLAEIASFLMQPQDVVCPFRRSETKGLAVPPHSQRHSHRAFTLDDPRLNPGTYFTTVRRPNRVPIISLAIISAMLTPACSMVQLPNVRLCGVAGILAAGADCAYSVQEKTEEMSLREFLAFLEGDETGPALCISSNDWRRLKTSTEQACKKLGAGCTREMQDTITSVSDRVAAMRARPHQ